MDNEKVIAEYILLNGKQYEPAVCPANVMRGKVGDCFDIALINALHTELRYVEGLALNPHVKDEWILHAWLTDGHYAYDPTWGAYDQDKKPVPVPTYYIGFEMDTKAVAEFVLGTKYKGVIANADKNEELARKALPAGFP